MKGNSRGSKTNPTNRNKTATSQNQDVSSSGEQKYGVFVLSDGGKGHYSSLRIVLIGLVVGILLLITTVTASSILSASGIFSYEEIDVQYRQDGDDSRYKPSLCSDGQTYGYSDWATLRLAITEVNDLSASLMTVGDGKRYVQLPPPPKPFVICPGITLRGRNRKGPIFINSEDVVIECDSCTVNMGATHFSFGSNAKGAVLRGVTFMGAMSSSVTFWHHGADVTFEDCIWIGNSGTNNNGAVADLNSTSSVSFFRCEISDSKQSPRAMSHGAQGMSSSLTIRN